MAIPLAPLASIAIRYGTVALTTYLVTKSVPRMRRNQITEDTFDELDEGFSARADRPTAQDRQVNAAVRLRRSIRLGASGPGIHLDLAALARLRLERLRKNQ